MPGSQRYTIDSGSSVFVVNARSTLHPISASAPLHGWCDFALTDAGGFDASQPMTGHIDVPVDKLSSGNALVDRETRRRIDLGRNPSISGEIIGTSSISDDLAHLEGQVRFHGQSVAISGQLGLSRIASGAHHLSGQGMFDVRAWGLEPPRLLTLRVDPEVHVVINATIKPVQSRAR